VASRNASLAPAAPPQASLSWPACPRTCRLRRSPPRRPERPAQGSGPPGHDGGAGRPRSRRRIGRSADRLLKAMDAEGIAGRSSSPPCRPSHGLTESVNPWIARYVEGHRRPARPRRRTFTAAHPDLAGDMKRLPRSTVSAPSRSIRPHGDGGERLSDRLSSLADVYPLAGEAGRPVSSHGDVRLSRRPECLRAMP